MKQFLRTIDSISDWSGRISSYLVFFGIFILAFEVIARYFFDSPTVWAHGYSQRVFGSYFVLVGAYTLLKNGHVRVDIIYQRFSLRKRAFLDLVNYSLLLIWSFVLIREGWMFFMSSFTIREADEMVLAHPVYPVKLMLFLGAALITLQGINRLIVSIIVLIKGVKYEY